MFYGEFEHSLDKKGRIILPSKFRQVMKENYAEKLFLTEASIPVYLFYRRRVENAGSKIPGDFIHKKRRKKI